MAHYILLMTLTPDGRERLMRNSGAVAQATYDVVVPHVSNLGLYAVLGDYDFVNIVEAPDNDAIARYSIELGVRAGVHIATLPAVPIAQLNGIGDNRPYTDTSVEMDMPSRSRFEEETR